MKRTAEDIMVAIIFAINKLKTEKEVSITTNQLSRITGLPSVVLNKYIPIFSKIGKLEIIETVSNRGVEKTIDISKFDLSVVELVR